MSKTAIQNITLINYDQITIALDRITGEINKEFKELDPILVCILDGGFMFFSDLVRRLTIPHQTAFIKLASDREEPDEVEWILKPSIAIKGRAIIVVDDIIDTGATAKTVTNYLEMNKAKSVWFGALLSKMARRKHCIFAPYIGFDIEDHFVYGYGMGRGDRDRNLLRIFRDLT